MSRPAPQRSVLADAPAARLTIVAAVTSKFLNFIAFPVVCSRQPSEAPKARGVDVFVEGFSPCGSDRGSLDPSIFKPVGICVNYFVNNFVIQQQVTEI